MVYRKPGSDPRQAQLTASIAAEDELRGALRLDRKSSRIYRVVAGRFVGPSPIPTPLELERIRFRWASCAPASDLPSQQKSVLSDINSILSALSKSFIWVSRAEDLPSIT